MSNLPKNSFVKPLREVSYRAYRLTASGSIEGVEHVEAHDDDEAMALAASIANGHGIDLWERARFLGSFPPLSVTVTVPSARAQTLDGIGSAP